MRQDVLLWAQNAPELLSVWQGMDVGSHGNEHVALCVFFGDVAPSVDEKSRLISVSLRPRAVWSVVQLCSVCTAGFREPCCQEGSKFVDQVRHWLSQGCQSSSQSVPMPRLLASMRSPSD